MESKSSSSKPQQQDSRQPTKKRSRWAEFMPPSPDSSSSSESEMCYTPAVKSAPPARKRTRRQKSRRMPALHGPTRMADIPPSSHSCLSASLPPIPPAGPKTSGSLLSLSTPWDGTKREATVALRAALRDLGKDIRLVSKPHQRQVCSL